MGQPFHSGRLCAPGSDMESGGGNSNGGHDLGIARPEPGLNHIRSPGLSPKVLNLTRRRMMRMSNVPCLPCQREKPKSIIGQAGGSAGRVSQGSASPSNRGASLLQLDNPTVLSTVYGTHVYISNGKVECQGI